METKTNEINKKVFICTYSLCYTSYAVDGYKMSRTRFIFQSPFILTSLVHLKMIKRIALHTNRFVRHCLLRPLFPKLNLSICCAIAYTFLHNFLLSLRQVSIFWSFYPFYHVVRR